MKKLRARVETVSQRNKRYRLTVKESGSKAAAAAEQSSSLVAAAIFGVDDAWHAAKHENQRADLVDLINNEDEDLKVIGVWGTSGVVGHNTPIIRAAYENPDVRSKFPGRAWIRVMHPFSPKGFFQSLVNQFHAAQGVEVFLEKDKTEQDLAQQFNRYMNERRCLIVLNDLSTIEEWDHIKQCFRNNKNGSRIIVSTAQVEVASLCAGQESQASELYDVDQKLYAFFKKVIFSIWR
ncbi:Pib [Panicum miliaceum]|uniref:Pib n=1 Tax=Panicum miliaceum TaxID=4540 RepID=A0A3L6Q5Q7_PANMI|nr:Pib [Panicum miliaceum]